MTGLGCSSELFPLNFSHPTPLGAYAPIEQIRTEQFSNSFFGLIDWVRDIPSCTKSGDFITRLASTAMNKLAYLAGVGPDASTVFSSVKLCGVENIFNVSIENRSDIMQSSSFVHPAVTTLDMTSKLSSTVTQLFSMSCDGDFQFMSPKYLASLTIHLPTKAIVQGIESIVNSMESCRGGFASLVPDVIKRHFYPWSVPFWGSVFFSDPDSSVMNGMTPENVMDRMLSYYGEDLAFKGDFSNVAYELSRAHTHTHTHTTTTKN
jgi:hypothetical protein